MIASTCVGEHGSSGAIRLYSSVVCQREEKKGKRAKKKEQAAVKAAILISPSERANIGNESRLKGKRAHV